MILKRIQPKPEKEQMEKSDQTIADLIEASYSTYLLNKNKLD